ncbi:MAG TPA: hypothetical protein VD833_18365 [Vicinamibacterales bacterium]|nr:hypothetical protein [Vicinamibacterales bacterium]
MTAQRLVKAILVALALMLAVPAGAQTNVTTSDIQRLQDDVYQASLDVSRMRSTDSSGASRLQDELDDLRDEVTYLKVKLRKEGSVNRSEYTELRDRLQDLRSRARGEGPARRSSTGASTGGVYGDSRADDRSTTSPTTRTGSQSGIPVGTEVDVRLQSQLSSDNAQVEDRFEATTMVDLSEGNRVLIPAGSMMRGIVSSVDRASRTDRKGSLTVSFDQVTINGRAYPMRGTVTQALESEGIRGEVGRIGAGSAVGAIIGGIIGGVRGALIGVLIGGGGTMVATEGKDVTLPPGTILRVRLDTPPQIR